MIIQCQNCSRKFIVKDIDIPKEGRTVKCGYCSDTWFQEPTSIPKRPSKMEKDTKSDVTTEENPSVDKIKASDGKTYKFLGGQWAEVHASGKTGLFARKKISRELDQITGRKERRITKKRKRKSEEVDPSSINLDNQKRLPDIYEPKKGLGFFGYIFLLIVIGFSAVGILKTFEDDLINYFPEIEYIFEILNEQLEYLSESVKNLIVIVNDLINSY